MGGDRRHRPTQGRQHLLLQNHKEGWRGVGAGELLTEVSTEGAPSLGASITLSSLQEAESVATAITAGHDCYSTKPVPTMEVGKEKTRHCRTNESGVAYHSD